jgi:hypothetical protein
VKENPKFLSELDLLKVLKTQWYCYFSDINLLILTDSQFVSQVFPQSHFDEYAFRYLVETQNECYIIWEKEEKKTEKLFRVLIDSTWWIESMIHRKLTTVWSPDQRFGEDALRLIRGLRLVNDCNYQLLQLDKKRKAKKSENWNLEKVQLFDFSAETWESIKKILHFWLV